MWFYLIDKPLDITSFDVIRKLRKILNTSKMWHTWTLDPLATGGLLIAVWNYTKLIPYFEKDTKEYEFTLSLDWVSESYDLWTPVDYISDKEKEYYKDKLSIYFLQDIIDKNFTWKIYQVPPKYSALKIDWKKALELVKSWVDFEMKKRESFIYEIEVLSYSYPFLSIRAKVSAWTYIRSIAFDLWHIVGSWAHVTKLRRTKIWNLDIKLSQTLDNFNPDYILEDKELFNKDNFISLEQDVLLKINNGLKVERSFDFKVGEDLFVYDWKNITNIVNYDWKTLKAIRKI